MFATSPKISARAMERLLLAAAVVLPAVIVAVVVVRESVRPQAEIGGGAEVHTAGLNSGQNKPSVVSPPELVGSYQGWTRKEDGTTAMMVLRISNADASGRFAYTLNVGPYRKDGNGNLGTDGSVTLGKFHGRIERLGDELTFLSWPPDQLPIWKVSGDTRSGITER